MHPIPDPKDTWWLGYNITYFTKTTFFPAARIKNVELVGAHIGGSLDPNVGI